MPFPVDPSAGRSSRPQQDGPAACVRGTSAPAPAAAGLGARPRSFGGVRLPSNPGARRARAKRERTEPKVALRCLSAAVVGVAAGVRCLVAAGTLTLSERIIAGFNHLQARRVTTGIDAQAVARDFVTASLTPEPGDPNSRLLHAGALPARVPADLQGATREATTANVRAALARKIDAGAALFAKIQQGRPPGRCSDEHASDLIWFFEVHCQLRGQSGGLRISLGDERGLLQAFLETHPGVYSLRHGGRGLDFYGTNPPSLDGVLPRESHALVFHPGRPGAKEDPARLFLRLAPHGAFLSTGGDAKGPHRLGNRHDVGAFMARIADGLRESLGWKSRTSPPQWVRLDP